MIHQINEFLQQKYKAINFTMIMILISLYIILISLIFSFNNSLIESNLASKHRILVEKIAITATNIVFTEDQNVRSCLKDNIITDTRLLKSLNDSLICIKSVNLSNGTTKEKVDYLNFTNRVKDVNNLIEYAENLIEADNSNESLKPNLLASLEYIKDKLLTDLDSNFSSCNQDKNLMKYHVEIVLLLFTLVVGLILILFTYWLIIMPLVNKNVKKVLVIEDNKVNAKILKSILIKQKLSVEISTNAQQSLHNLEKNHDYDLIIMDCEMPIMDGFECTLNIRQREKELNLKRIPIIGLTSNHSEAYVKHCKEVDMNSVIFKPINKELASKVINEWVNKK
ncbi:MAG: response regulator [Rickettsiaceae bacterium]|nr:response regulator [Rickettsiaceae bacterium]